MNDSAKVKGVCVCVSGGAGAVDFTLARGCFWRKRGVGDLEGDEALDGCVWSLGEQRDGPQLMYLLPSGSALVHRHTSLFPVTVDQIAGICAVPL